jgi:hypothetical protein
MLDTENVVTEVSSRQALQKVHRVMHTALPNTMGYSTARVAGQIVYVQAAQYGGCHPNASSCAGSWPAEGGKQAYTA